MNEEKISTSSLLFSLDQLLSIIQNGIPAKSKKRIPLNELHELVLKANRLLENVESDIKRSSELVIKRYIPILNNLMLVETDPKRKYDYINSLKNCYKIASRVSLRHYFVYREWGEKSQFYKPRRKMLEGYIHYLQEIDSNPVFEWLIVCMPSGYGKTFPEKVSEAWSFGKDSQGTILSICSNDDVVKGGSRTVIDEIKSQAFGEVFPDLKYDKTDKTFFLKETDENWKLRDCKLLASYYATTTKSNTVGERASKRVHIDDLYPDPKEAMNTSLNQYYYDKFQTVWKKRFLQELQYHKIVITGTLWSSDDFIARIISWLSSMYKFEKDPNYKYTKICKNENGQITGAIVRIPALDYETNESVCPELRTTEKILEDKNAIDDYLFQTNFQQIPTDPESLFFSYNSLRTYETVPPSEYIGTYSVIDATRKSGKDFFAMPIFRKVQNDNIFDYYLIDCLFTKTATKDMYNTIVDKIIEHHIIKLVIESNVTTELAKNVREILKSMGITWCEIIEKYNTIPKPIRIENEKGIIKRQLVFPKKGMYGPNTDMGKFMNNLTMYNNAGSNPNDDAPDSCALMSSEIIEGNSMPSKAVAIPDIRKYF